MILFKRREVLVDCGCVELKTCTVLNLWRVFLGFRGYWWVSLSSTPLKQEGRTGNSTGGTNLSSSAPWRTCISLVPRSLDTLEDTQLKYCLRVHRLSLPLAPKGHRGEYPVAQLSSWEIQQLWMVVQSVGVSIECWVLRPEVQVPLEKDRVCKAVGAPVCAFPGKWEEIVGGESRLCGWTGAA